MGRERQAQGGETHGAYYVLGTPFNLHKPKGRVLMSSFYKPGQKLREVKSPSKATQQGPCLELELGLRPKPKHVVWSFHPDNNS